MVQDRLIDEVLDGLNPLQKEAITHEDGHLLIIAGAGTGKTRVITRRIAYLIASQKAHSEEILALTFTEKAAQEMEERVDILVPYGFTDYWISTFHAFGNRVLRENALELGINPNFKILTRPEQIIFFREHLFEFNLDYFRPLSDPTAHIDAILTFISRAKDEDISPKEYIDYATRLKEEAATRPHDEVAQEVAKREAELAHTYKTYQELLTREGKADFGDQITLTLKLFREHPAVLKKYQERFRYILVDEFQDTNYAQFELIKLLVKGGAALTVVADDDQSIYKFRGAAISNVLGFMNTYKDARKIVLTQNYRSPQRILDSAHSLIQHNNPERLEAKEGINKRLVSCKGDGKGPFSIHYETLSAEADGVARIIKEKVEGGGYSYSDFALLVRSNSDAKPYIQALNMLGIPWSFTRKQDLYSTEEVTLLVSFLRVVADLEDSMSLYYLASSPIYQMEIQDLHLCMNYATHRHRSLYYVFRHLEKIERLKEIPSSSRRTVSRILEDITHFIKMSRDHPPGEVLYAFLEKSGYLERLTLNGEEGKIQNIAKFFDIIKNFSSTTKNDRVHQFISHFDMLIEAGDEPDAAEIEVERDVVNLLTVHKAKGLEFRVVFMVGLVEKGFPTPSRKEPIELPNSLIKDILPQGDFHLQEERRLFYVGMTRAKEELYFTSAQDYGGKRPRKVSRFVLEALDLEGSDLKMIKTSTLEAIHRHAPPPIEKEGQLLKEIRDEDPLTISYYQIDDFLTCPLKYKYVHILRVPVLAHHTVVYGRALHLAIQEYHRRRMRGEDVTLEDMYRVFEEGWLSEGFLSREHEARRIKQGKETLKRFYEENRREKKLPTYIEKGFSFLVGKNRVIGRWDRIDEEDGKVRIIDYKSTEVGDQKKADKKSKESLQLSIYALAYREMFGRIPDLLELHFVEDGYVGRSQRSEEEIEETVSLVMEAASGIRKREFLPKPSFQGCRYCAYRLICPKRER
jgi:DNA helicase-2/ATP-dependent DNA helicase PcrA